MKPTGIAKNGSAYWDLYRVPVNVLIYQQKHTWVPLNSAQNYFAGVLSGIKCFEKPGKITLMYVINDLEKKKYVYKWMATFNFKKNSVTLNLNMLPWNKPGKKFSNATYRITAWNEILDKAISGFPTKEMTRKLPTSTKRRQNFSSRLNQLILWKAKKEGINVGNLNIQLAKKTSTPLFMLSVGSELITNTLYYFNNQNPHIPRIHANMDFAASNKKFRYIIKALKKYNSMEKVCKKVFGRNTKFIMKAVQASIMRLSFSEVRHEEIPVVNGVAELNGQIYAVPPGQNSIQISKRETISYFDLSVFLLGHFLKDKINLDKVQRMFEDISIVGSDAPVLFPDPHAMFAINDKILRLTQALGEEKTKKLFIEIWCSGSRDSILNKLGFLRDMSNQWCEKSDKIPLNVKWKDLVDLHDYITKEYRKLQHADFELKFNEEVQKIDGVSLEGGLYLELPKTNHTLIDWGQKMNNCIGGYGRNVNNSDGKQWVLGVYKDGKLTYNIEVYNKNLRQFYAHHNSLPDPQDKVTVLKFLAEKELARESDMHSAVMELQRALEAGVHNGQPLQVEPLELAGLDAQLRQVDNHHLDAMRYGMVNVRVPERNIIIDDVLQPEADEEAI